MKRLVSVGMLLLLTGCAIWVKTEGPVTSDSQGFTVMPPEGWMRRNTGKFFLMTKDGLSLQTVAISRVKVSEEKQFNYTKKRVTPGMLPNEVAEVIIDDYQSDAEHPVEAVEENVPAKIADRAGCRIRVSFTSQSGLKYRCMIYGWVAGDWLYRVTYVAPARYYFEKDAPAVQEMMKTFRLTGEGAATKL